MRTLLAIFLTLPLLSACSAFRPDIQQGNVLEADQVKKLTIGMSKKQVSFLLGSPLLQDPFHRNRWDYIFTLKQPDVPMIRQRLTLYFKDEALEKIDDSQLEKQPVEN